jgi:putative hydrolases of HD superfamily
MYRMAIITMCAPASLASKLDLQRCTMLALVHDMAESLVGDITPVDGVPKAEKSRREEETMDYLCKALLGNVDGGTAGDRIRAAWREYEDNKTLEAQFVHDVDKVELILQMVEYEKATQGTRDLSEFVYVASKVETPEVKAWCDQLLEEREAYKRTIDKTTLSNSSTADKDKQLHRSQMDEYYSKS